MKPLRQCAIGHQVEVDTVCSRCVWKWS